MGMAGGSPVVPGGEAKRPGRQHGALALCTHQAGLLTVEGGATGPQAQQTRPGPSLQVTVCTRKHLVFVSIITLYVCVIFIYLFIYFYFN